MSSILPGLVLLQNLTKQLLLSNDISGAIPPDIGQCHSLRLHSLTNQRLAGINFLNLSSNRITGTVSDEIGKFSQLQMLKISNNTLFGELPASLGSITDLLILDASLKKFTGPTIPESLGKLAKLALELLDLSNNHLTGVIPDEPCEIEGLDIALNLRRNMLIGPIPVKISKLGKLSMLDLSYNNLNGNLAELAGLDNLIGLNISNNNFTGYLLDTQLFHQRSASDLAGNEGLCTHDGDVCFMSSNVTCVTSTAKKSWRLHKLKLAIILLITITVAMVEQLVSSLVDANIIGKGCSGIVYRVSMCNGEVIPVKKLWLSIGRVVAMSKEEETSVRVRDSFSAEVRRLGAIRHKNIIRFLGCCWNRRTRLMMYDYMANGSLGGLLHDRNKCPLEWDLRYQIILGAAQGLAYLQQDCIPPIVHKDIKANNTLIGLDFEPYITDFGLAKLVEEGDFARSSNTITGSYGYIELFGSSWSVCKRRTYWIEAKCGFTQGYPLSPYLYILCSQLLSYAIHQRGAELGVKISPKFEKITHLLYADDILVLSNATLRSARCLKNILKKFCGWTGQSVNIMKSQIIFAKSVRGNCKKKISKKLGFLIVNEMHYLGVKLVVRRPLKSDFRSIIDHALTKLNAWGSRSLSMAGSVLLIKSSLLSLPIFLSTLTLVPKSILHNLDKLCRDFLWNKDKVRKGLHYIAWDELCKPKLLGGLGIHSSIAKIGPLSSRITWRFIHNPNLLCNRIIISKYGNDVWNGKFRRGNSPTWKILLDGANYLKHIIRWKISNGIKVNAMEDTWILDKPISKWPTFVNCIDLQDQSVHNLLAEDGSWNNKVLPKFFNKDLIEIITSIKLFPEENGDQIELIKQHARISISALVYEAWMETHCYVSETQSIEILNYFRKFKLMSKVEMFWWRHCKNGIPTNSFLNYRGFIQSSLCPCDCNESENLDHVAVSCLQVLKIINKLNCWGFPVPTFDLFSKCLIELKRLSIENLNIVKLYCTTIYYSWKRRNQIKLGVESSSINFLASNVLAAISHSYNNLRNWDTNLLWESVHTWRPPPLDWIKINVDATLQRSYNAGIGAIIRDHKGCFLYAFGNNLKHWDITNLELQAILAIREHLQRWMLLQKGVIIEGDNKNVIKWIEDSL
ncbi:hypothetical protein M5K25_012962 [Dendrobium thyrsiflorum]|uniref:Protein kinase domain-containing protein n=1 Tax=Dendrobium thyrsiflorum TaxID=117978 RepID=A0ABD0V5P0_DENTH